MSDRVEVPAVVLMYAFRYALGRQTYAVGDMADQLLAHADALRPDWKGQIVRDIQEALRNDAAGHAMDRERWLEVHNAFVRQLHADPGAEARRAIQEFAVSKAAVRAAWDQLEANERASAQLDDDGGDAA